jgi:hypothetical protein
MRRLPALILTLLIAVPAIADGKNFFQDIGDRIRKRKKIINLVLNPVGAAVGEVARKGAKKVGIDPNVAENAANPLNVSTAEKAVESAVVAVSVEKEYMETLATAIVEGDVQKIAVNELRHVVRNAIDNPATTEAAKLAAVVGLAHTPRDLVMDAPDVEKVNPGGFKSRMMYYVNGINTPRDQAIITANAISLQFKRPVGLIYNRSTQGQGDLNPVLDVFESAYDRIWPFAQLTTGVNPQLNPTTRRLAGLFYETKEPVDIISYSQSCLQVRNALVIASQYSDRAVENVSWVACGTPLKDSEIIVRSGRYRAFRNLDDKVSQIVGGEFDADLRLKDQGKGHDIQSYLPKIAPDNFAPLKDPKKKKKK